MSFSSEGVLDLYKQALLGATSLATSKTSRKLKIMNRYVKDLDSAPKVHQTEGHQGDRWEIGRGNT
jgi:hypothetical protein